MDEFQSNYFTDLREPRTELPKDIDGHEAKHLAELRRWLAIIGMRRDMTQLCWVLSQLLDAGEIRYQRVSWRGRVDDFFIADHAEAHAEQLLRSLTDPDPVEWGLAKAFAAKNLYWLKLDAIKDKRDLVFTGSDEFINWPKNQTAWRA